MGNSQTENHQHRIVQCPNCQTKYGVEWSQVSQVDVPRFHCSRCDSVFALEQENPGQTARISVPEAAVGSAERYNSEGYNSETENSAIDNFVEDDLAYPQTENDNFSDENDGYNQLLNLNQNLPISQTPASQIDQNTNPDADYSTEEYADHEAVVVIPEDLEHELREQEQNYGRSLNVPRSIDSNRAWQAPHEAEPQYCSSQQVQEPNDDYGNYDSHDVEHIKTTRLVQQELPLAMPTAKPVLFPSPASWEARARAEISGRKTVQIDRAQVMDQLERDTSFSAFAPDGSESVPGASVGNTRRVRGPITGWRAVASFGAPLGAFLLILLACSLYFQSSPLSAEQFIGKFFANSPHPAPAGLEIEDSSIKTAVLDNGESISLLSGTIVNNSQSTFREIILEGAVYDARNQELANLQISASATLAKTRFRSLTLDMIAKLQSGRGARNFALKPGQKSEFAFAALNVDPKQVRYYSTRIFSVREN